MKPRLDRILAAPSKRPLTTLAAAAILTLLAIVGASRLKVHAALDAMFPLHDPAADAMTDVMDHYQTVDELLVLVRLPQEDTQPDPARLIAYTQRLQNVIATSPAAGLAQAVIYGSQPDAAQFIQRELVPAGLFYLDDDQFAAARDRLTLGGMRLQLAHDQAMLSQPGPAAEEVSKAMMQDPLALHDFLASLLAGSRPMAIYQNSDALISPDGKSLLIRVIGNRPPTDLAYATALTDAITTAAEQASPAGLRIGLAGAYPIAAISERSIRRDAIESIISSVLLLVGVFAVVYRKPIGMFHLAFAPVALGILWGFGVYGLSLQSLSPIAAVIGGVLAGMGIDYSVLYLTCYQSLRFDGADAPQAAQRTIETIGSALTAAFVTSVAGFIAIGYSSIQAMRNFAILGTMGLTGSFLATLFVLPALLVLTGWQGHSPGHPAFRFSMRPLIRWAASHRSGLSAICAAIALICAIAAISGRGVIAPEADLTVMHPRPNSALDTEEEIGRQFGVSAGTMLIRLRANDERQLLTLAHQVKQRLSSPQMKAAGIAGTYGVAAWLPDPATVAWRTKTLSAVSADQVANDFRTAVNESALSMAAFEAYDSFLRQLLDPQRVPDIQTLRQYNGLARDLLPSHEADGSSSAVTAVFLTGSEESASDRDKEIDAVHSALNGLAGTTLTGLPVIGHDADLAVRSELPRLLWIAAALVAGYLLLHFRNPREVFLSLLPAAFGLATLAGIARLTGIRLNMINFVALPLLIGIDVDYGIYLVSLARRTAVDSGAQAVVVCATSMIAGYASLILTSVPAIQSLGVIVSVGVTSCLIGTLFLLCPLLRRVE